MIPAFELVTPEAVSDERLFALMHRMHQISLELGRVYDVVPRPSAPRGLPVGSLIEQCNSGTEDERGRNLLTAGSRFRRVYLAITRLRDEHCSQKPAQTPDLKQSLRHHEAVGARIPWAARVRGLREIGGALRCPRARSAALRSL